MGTNGSVIEHGGTIRSLRCEPLARLLFWLAVSCECMSVPGRDQQQRWKPCTKRDIALLFSQ